MVNSVAMRTLPGRWILLRWMFEIAGFVLILGNRRVAGFWAARSPLAHTFAVVAALLCWIAAAGLKRKKPWARTVALVSSALLVCAFPWFTPAGLAALWMLRSAPPAAAAPLLPRVPTADFWESKRHSRLQGALHGILWILAFFSQGWFAGYARRTGIPVWNAGWKWWPFFFCFVLFNIAIHEFGHALAAWLAGFQLRVISIGPFTFWHKHGRLHFRFTLARLFESGGYMGAVPLRDDGLRAKQILVVLSGPLANFLSCLLALKLFFHMPGTSWQGWWWLAVLNVTVAGVMAAGNLIPVGYCDGTMLLHLVLWTNAGRILLDRQRVVQLGEEADLCHGRADFDREIEIKQQMVDRSRALGPANALMIAACEQALGTACALADDWPSAEFHYGKALECKGEIAAKPALAANVWSGLHMALVRRYDSVATGPVYATLVQLLQHRKADPGALSEPAVTFAMLAQAHLRNGALQEALHEITGGLAIVPDRAVATSLRAHLLRAQADCYLRLGNPEAGLAAARDAVDLFRSPAILAGRRNLAWEDIADLGQALFAAGDTTLSIALLREGIAGLESGGAQAIAGKYRIKLAAALRRMGFCSEAWAEMPDEETLSAARWRAFLAERAEQHLARGCPDLAAEDARRLVALWQQHPCNARPEIASGGALLARACVAAGNFLEAEALALQALEVLRKYDHPDATSCQEVLDAVRAPV